TTSPTPATSSTTTTSTTSSSSTLPPIIPPLSCVTDADCNDGGPCTDRRCAGGGCVYQPLVGFPGVECELGQGLAAPLCGPEAIDPTLQRVITRRIAKAQSLVQKAASRMDRKSVRIRLLKGAARNLRVVQRQIGRAHV